jgi:quaternary ammonium compound-resistance protein SugE
MVWVQLVIAGLLEVIGAVGLTYTRGFTRIGYVGLVLDALAASFYLLSDALRVLPVGTAYAVWTGIGAAGTALFGIMFLGEPLNLGRMSGLALVIGGSVGMKLFA